MANHKSAEKRIRQTARRCARNRTATSRLRTKLKAFQNALGAGRKDDAAKLLGPTISLVDKSVQKGVLHRNKANRIKSSITVAANKLNAAE